MQIIVLVISFYIVFYFFEIWRSNQYMIIDVIVKIPDICILIGQNSVHISDIFLFLPCKYQWNVQHINWGGEISLVRETKKIEKFETI